MEGSGRPEDIVQVLTSEDFRRVHLKRPVDLMKNDLGPEGVFVSMNDLDMLPRPSFLDFVNIARNEIFDIPEGWVSLLQGRLQSGQGLSRGTGMHPVWLNLKR